MGVLIKCATCGGKVSSAAKACPHCGEPDFHGDALADYRVEAIALQAGQGSTQEMAVDERSVSPFTSEPLSNKANGFCNGQSSNGYASNGQASNGQASHHVPPLTNAPPENPPTAAPLAPTPPDVDASMDAAARSPHEPATEDPERTLETPATVAADSPTVPSVPMLVYWASLGQFEHLQQNIAQFPDVNASDASGYTALHAAAEYGYTDITECLLAHGANCNVRYTPTGHTSAYAGFTPLMLAEKAGHHAVAELIRTKMEADQAQRLAAAPRPRVQHSPIVKQAIADVAASARQSQPRVVGHNHALGAKHLDVTYVFDNRSDLQAARRNGKCEWLQFETRAALKKRGFPLQIYPTINVWFKDKTSFYMNEGRNEFR
jgi:uncharacterized protein